MLSYIRSKLSGYQAPRPLRTESEVAEKEGAERIVKALPAPDLSMKELRIGHKKNERSSFGKTNPIRAEEGLLDQMESK
jgi:hypothetical protein